MLYSLEIVLVHMLINAALGRLVGHFYPEGCTKLLSRMPAVPNIQEVTPSCLLFRRPAFIGRYWD